MSPLVTEPRSHSSSHALDRALEEIPGRVLRLQWKLVRETARDIARELRHPPYPEHTAYARYLRYLAIPSRVCPVTALRHNMIREAAAYRSRAPHGAYMRFIDARAMLVVARYRRRIAWRES